MVTDDTSASGSEALLPLTPAVFHIMLALLDKEKHGYAIMQEVEHLTKGQLSLGAGTLYRSIQRMLADGLIEESALDIEDDDERRRYYKLTPFGVSVAKDEAKRLALLVDVSRQKGLLKTKGKTHA